VATTPASSAPGSRSEVSCCPARSTVVAWLAARGRRSRGRSLWHARGTFGLHVQAWDTINEVFGQLVIIALPEEAFYRGYLQSRLDEALPGRIRILGATVGPALIVTSVIFALGHFATIREPARLAVFFPSLVFGWLRARTKGIGASVAFHASCNIFSELLGKGYRVY
jgi:hypothetical protein